jgi:gamma-glutamylaminecyclotransferase
MRLFVYGTLKRGFRNVGLMAGQTYVGPVVTAPRYRLYDLGDHPGLVEDGNGRAVRGEVWEVTAEGLARVDEFEASDEGEFRRGEIELADGSAAQAYFYNRDVTGRPDLGVEYTRRG